MKNVIDLFKAARRVSTPIVAIASPDQPQLVRKLFKAIGNGDTPGPKLTYDLILGLRPVNDSARSMLAAFDQSAVMSAQSPTGMLALAPKFLSGTVVVMLNAHRFVGDASVVQGIANLRDLFTEDRRTLVLTGPSFDLQPDLQDVVLLEEELPDDKELDEILSKTYASAYPDSTENIKAEWVDAVRGLSGFAAEQVFAMSLTKDGVDGDDLWERKQAAINQTRGLSFVRSGPTFDQLGGLDSWKTYMRRLRHRPGVIVFADEIDKSMAGSQSDSTGVTQDIHGTLLSWMQDYYHNGIIAVGPPGSGKTAAGMAIGPELGIPTIVLDINALKQKHVGESEGNVRAALATINSVAGDAGAFVFATCNSEQKLAPEFKRRFRAGEWFFDLPTEEERDVIWSIHLSNYEFPVDIGKRPDDSNWTGAEIRNCCDLAWQLGSTLIEAAQYVVPVAKASADTIDALRNQAYGTWLSASYPGPYQGVQDGGGEIHESFRKVQLAD